MKKIQYQKRIQIVIESIHNIIFILKHLFRKTPFLTILSFVVFTFVGVFPLFISYLYKSIIDMLTNGSIVNTNVSRLLYLVIGYIIVTITLKVVEILKGYINLKLGFKMSHAFSLIYLDKFEEIDLKNLDDPDFFDTISRSQADINRHPEKLMFSLIEVFENLLSVVSYLIVIIRYSPFLLVLCAISLFFTSINYKEDKNKQYQWQQSVVSSKRKTAYYDKVQYRHEYLPEVRMFNLMSFFEDKYKESKRNLFEGELKLDLQSRVVQIINNLIRESVTLGIQLYLACMVILSKLSLGDYTLMVSAVESVVRDGRYFFNSLIDTYILSKDIQHFRIFLNLQNSIIKKEEIQNRKIQRNKGKHKIEFKNVSFKYEGSEHEALSDVSFVIEPGETVALVGENGSGKSTIMKLLLRLYDPTKGNIYLDGINLKNYDVLDYYSVIGAMFQKNLNYAVSVEESVWFGDTSDVLEKANGKVDNALKFADLYDTVQRLKNQKRSTTSNQFDENGFEPSGGELQKLALARAYFRKSELIVLDEPSSALDAISEKNFFDKIYHLKNEVTTMIITHRLSNVHLSSKIIVLDRGQIIEFGKHAELISQKGKYFELYQKQAQHYL